MSRTPAKQGFTLVELLVVISLIVVLMAILFPAFQSAREKANQTRCISNMHKIVTALKVYQQDYRLYPPPPVWDSTLKLYTGGVSALYPEYIESSDTFVCPDDRKIDHVEAEAAKRHYSSYNGVVEDPQSGEDQKWDFYLLPVAATPTPAAGTDQSKPRWRLYNWGGYQADGFDHCYMDTTTNKWTLGDPTLDPKITPIPPTWLSNQGLSWRKFPRLQNRRAPDNTIVIHCWSHRDFYKTGDEVDPLIRLGGEATTTKINDMAAVDSTYAIEPWIGQFH